MEVITYSLRNGQERSDRYYRDVAAFAGEVVAEAEGRVRPQVEALQSYLQEEEEEDPRTFPEHALELLALGVFWQVYAGAALALPWLPRHLLAGLVQLRRRGGWVKKSADILRGALAPLLRSPHHRRPAEPPSLTVETLGRLVSWLAATGDLDQEARRLALWQRFLTTRPAEEAAAALAAAAAFAGWFRRRSEAVLGPYTPQVERFLAEVHPHYRWREDAIFCGRQRVEYHLNMVGTEILNRAFREAFLATRRKAVLLPPCMKARGDSACQARPTPFGARCAACTPGCRVRQLTELGEQHGFAVRILPDELAVFSAGRIRPEEGELAGIVGVSCVLTNVSGGWETRALGVPAQGVLLDYCGCRYHWHREGIPTDLNAGHLLQVLGIGEAG